MLLLINNLTKAKNKINPFLTQTIHHKKKDTIERTCFNFYDGYNGLILISLFYLSCIALMQ